MKDMLSNLLAFLFAEDKKAHPMPSERAESLLQTTKNILRATPEAAENDKKT